MLRFLTCLPDFGWQPIILTVKNGDYPVRDESLLAKIPTGVPVHRTFIPEPYQLYRKFTQRKEDEALDLSALSLSDQKELSLKERVAFMLRDWLFIPDPRVGWLPFALVQGLKLIREHKIDLIFSSAPPNSVHLIAYWLRRLSGKKWVADFRDPWFKYLAPRRSGWLPRKIDLALCKTVVKHADHLVWVCEGVRKEMSRAISSALPAHESIITNGFDAKNFEELQPEQHDKFRITYVGTFFSRYHIDAFVAAVERLMQEHKDFARDFELVFCGAVDQSVQQRLSDSKLSENVHFLGYQDHRTTLTKMVSSTLLLLYIMDTPEGRNIPTSKLFEYLGARRPILALAPEDSDAGRILVRTKAGFIVDGEDEDAIHRHLLGLYQSWKEGELNAWQPEENTVLEFEVRNLTKDMVRTWESK